MFIDAYSDEKLLSHDDDISLSQEIHRHRAWCGFAALWWLTNAASLAVILLLVLDRMYHPDRPRRHEIAGDINDVWPTFPSQVIEFQPDERFVGNLTSPTFVDDIKQHWMDIMPKGLGFIAVPDYADKPNLPASLAEYKTHVYTTSVTHQLHCLYMIMHGFNDLAVDHGAFAMDVAGKAGDEGLTREGEDPFEHLNHCFDYLGQAIMCHGDTALEGRQTTFGPNVGGSDGWNAKHVCKPWDRIYNWSEEQRVDDREWI